MSGFKDWPRRGSWMTPYPEQVDPVTPLEQKREAFEAQAEATLQYLFGLLAKHGQELTEVAWARHVTGHLRYGDAELFEYDEGALAGETFTELADAFIFCNRRLQITSS